MKGIRMTTCAVMPLFVKDIKYYNDMERTLFCNVQLRDHKGRFCTKERHYSDKAFNENKRLRLECEKYPRAFLALSKRCTSAEREVLELKQRIKELESKNG